MNMPATTKADNRKGINIINKMEEEMMHMESGQIQLQPPIDSLPSIVQLDKETEQINKATMFPKLSAQAKDEYIGYQNDE
jgi:hypothetical protein